MALPLTISQFIREHQDKSASGTFSSVMADIALACRMTASKLRYGNFTQTTDNTSNNASGDKQVPLDIMANNIFLDLAQNNGNIAALVSEEMEEIHYFKECKNPKYILIIDPLDGSGNLDINAPVASIFSIIKNPKAPAMPNKEQVMTEARNPIAAGICNYGLATTMALTFGKSVHGFTQDLESGVFLYTHQDMKIPHAAKEIAINFSNKNFWNPAVTQYVEECFNGEAGPRAQYFNTRWYASAAAELNRILNRGGVFLYPACSNGKPQGVLRKIYEAYPMAFLVEAAGGASTDGLNRILDLPCTDLHERVPFIMGSKPEVERLQAYHQKKTQ